MGVEVGTGVAYWTDSGLELVRICGRWTGVVYWGRLGLQLVGIGGGWAGQGQEN